MKKCGTCKYFKENEKQLGWAPSSTQGTCYAPLPHGYVVNHYQKALLTVEHGVKCPCWREKSG